MIIEKSKKFETLAIVGNGFDMAHNYKTGYKSFSDKTIHPSLKYFKDLCEDEESITTWYSFEENIKILTEKLFQKNFIEGCDYNEINLETEKLKEVFKNIHNLLIEYLKKETAKPLVIKDSIKRIVGSNTIAFNFNYTSTIEKYIENVIYIHGSLKENDILLGYDYRDEPCLASYQDVYWSKRICRENLAFRRFLKNSQNNIDKSKHDSFLNCLELYQTYVNSGRGLDDEIGQDISEFEVTKNIMHIVTENDYPNILYKEIKNIIVLGHGIEADKVYLDGLLQKCPNIEKIIIFRHNEEKDESCNKRISFFEPYCKTIKIAKY